MTNQLPQIETGQDGVKRWHIESVSKAVALAGDHTLGLSERGRRFANYRSMRTGRTWREFYNGYTPETLLSALRDCPAALLNDVVQMKDTIERRIPLSPTQRQRKRRRRLEAGDELDPVAWVQRDPEGWADTVRERRTKPVVRIGVNASVNSNVRPRVNRYRGAAAAAAADILTARGHAVEITLFETGTNPCKSLARYVATTLVKPSDAPLDLGAVAVAVAEVAFYRLVSLDILARMCDESMSEGLGQAASLPEADREGYDIIIDADVTSEESALAAVERAVEQWV